MTMIADTPLHATLFWDTDLRALLAEPSAVIENSTRERGAMGVSLSCRRTEQQTTVAVTVALFFLHLSPAVDAHTADDHAALSIFLDALQERDYHRRMAACKALGQQGLPAARAALQTAMQDENRHVRTAALAALRTLDVQRGHREELADLRLILWQQMGPLWKPIGSANTDVNGCAHFSHVPVEATCRFTMTRSAGAVAGKRPPAVAIALSRQTALMPALAATSGRVQTSSLPHSEKIPLHDGALVCTLSRDQNDRVIIEFRSDAPHLHGGWIHFTATSPQRPTHLVSESLELIPDRRQILTAHTVLSDLLDLTVGYEIVFEAIPAPVWSA